MRTPFFTIITPTLNSEKYLKESIMSVEDQEFKDWEHIFIDSFSTDKTIKIINDYKKRNPGKVLVYRYPKAGISDAFNKGIKHSKGVYINFLGSDDLLKENSLKIVYEKIKNKKYSWCYGNFDIINDKNNITKRKRYYFNNFHYNMLFFQFYICHQTVFMKKKIFNQYGLFRTDLKYAMDHEYWLRIGKKEKPFFIPKVLCNFRRDGNNITSKLWKEQTFEKKNINQRYCPFYIRPFSILFFYTNLMTDIIKGK